MTRTRLSLSELLESEEDLLVLIGAEDDEDGGADSEDQDEDNDDDASGDEDGESTDEDDEDGEDDEDDEDVPGLKARITALEKEKDRHFRKAAREKKRADGLQVLLDAKAPAAKDKSKDEDEDSSESARKVEVNTALALQNAFLMADTKHEFVNTKAALKLLDVSDIDIDEDGTVDGMDEAIEALAKDHPYLLKKKAAPARRKTGDGPTSSTKNSEKSAAAKKRELENRYPALRNR